NAAGSAAACASSAADTPPVGIVAAYVWAVVRTKPRLAASTTSAGKAFSLMWGSGACGEGGGDVGGRVLARLPDDPPDGLGVDGGVLGERDEGGGGRGELGPQRRQVLPRTEVTRRGVPENPLDGRPLPVRGGGLAGGVRDAAGKKLVDYLFRGGHLFLRG